MALTQISTDGVKDDAVTAGKIPANAVGSSELADNAVDTNAIQNDAVTQAKLATNSVGSQEIIPNNVITTSIADGAVTKSKIENLINNNADNRIITGSGTANTLNGESKLTFDGSSNLTLDAIVTVDRVINATSGADPWLKGVNSSNTETAYIKPDGQAFFNGNVGIGTTSPAQKLHCVGNLKLDSASGRTNISFGNSSGSTGWTAGDGILADAHQFVIYDNTAGAGRMLIDSNGIARFNNGIQLGNGVANSASHHLDDYEEGSFTPRLGGSANSSTYYADGTGTYIKIGRQVTVTIRFNNVDLNNNSSGTAKIFNMPFTSGHAPTNGVSAVTNNVQYYNVPFSTTHISNWYISGNTTSWGGLVSRSNQTWDNWPASDFHAATLYINFSGTYFTDS